MKLIRIDLKTGIVIQGGDLICESHPQITHKDENGDLTSINDPQYICTDYHGGFYLPRWDGEKLVEGLTQEEVEEIQNAPVQKTEIQILQEQNQTLIANIEKISQNATNSSIELLTLIAEIQGVNLNE